MFGGFICKIGGINRRLFLRFQHDIILFLYKIYFFSGEIIDKLIFQTL